MKRCLLFWLGLLVILTVQATPEHLEKIRVGDTLPDFSLDMYGGDTLHSFELRHRPCVIVFFHTRCYDCRRELPLVQQMFNDYGSKLQFVCISRAEKEDDVIGFWTQERLSLPFSAQEDKCIFKLFAERTIPRIYITDNKGRVQYMFKEKVSKRKLQKVFRKIIGNIEKL